MEISLTTGLVLSTSLLVWWTAIACYFGLPRSKVKYAIVMVALITVITYQVMLAYSRTAGPVYDSVQRALGALGIVYLVIFANIAIGWCIGRGLGLRNRKRQSISQI